jgi:putative transposase
MAIMTTTLKLPFLDLNRCKAIKFEELTCLNTEVANNIGAMPKEARRALTSKDFGSVEIGSGWINQTIRNANARTKVKEFKRLPLEVNHQGWKIHKVGETFSLIFNPLRGRSKRLPLQISPSQPCRHLERVAEWFGEAWKYEAVAVFQRSLVHSAVYKLGGSRPAVCKRLDE